MNRTLCYLLSNMAAKREVILICVYDEKSFGRIGECVNGGVRCGAVHGARAHERVTARVDGTNHRRNPGGAEIETEAQRWLLQHRRRHIIHGSTKTEQGRYRTRTNIVGWSHAQAASNSEEAGSGERAWR